MDYVKPADVANAMMDSGSRNLAPSTADLLVRGILSGAKVSVADWRLWNQVPATLGNLVGGFCFTGFTLYITSGRAPNRCGWGGWCRRRPNEDHR